jgi:hypothetical protein
MPCSIADREAPLFFDQQVSLSLKIPIERSGRCGCRIVTDRLKFVGDVPTARPPRACR